MKLGQVRFVIRTLPYLHFYRATHKLNSFDVIEMTGSEIYGTYVHRTVYVVGTSVCLSVWIVLHLSLSTEVSYGHTKIR